MAKPNPTQQKIIDIANKYGYKVVSCYASKFKKDGEVYNNLVFSPKERPSPEVYYEEDNFSTRVTGLDRFKINHSAFGSVSIQEEEEFITKLRSAIQMCKELNEVDLDGLPVKEYFKDSVNPARRSQIKELFNKV